MTWSCPICGDQLINDDQRGGQGKKFGFAFDEEEEGTPTLVCRPCNIYFTLNNLKSIINGQ
ncbi:MAG TPA: hypothetical protein VKA87_02640 [Nitrososphaeraceae archaeon]|nr:hypothetical protein [Nitrososphaeraceae archaeon]